METLSKTHNEYTTYYPHTKNRKEFSFRIDINVINVVIYQVIDMYENNIIKTWFSDCNVHGVYCLPLDFEKKYLHVYELQDDNTFYLLDVPQLKEVYQYINNIDNASYTYLMRDNNSGLYKIGKSNNPKRRLKQFKTSNIFIDLLAFGTGVTESYLHEKYKKCRVKLEWFNLSSTDIYHIKELINN